MRVTHRKIVAFIGFGLFAVALLWQNCGDINLSKGNVDASASLVCPDFANSKPENIYEDASLDPLKVLFKVNELDLSNQLISSQRTFQWYINDSLISSGPSLEKNLSDFSFCQSQNIQAKLVACGNTYVWKKSYLKSNSTCMPTPTPTPTPSPTPTPTPPPGATVSCPASASPNIIFNTGTTNYFAFSTGISSTRSITGDDPVIVSPDSGYKNRIYDDYGRGNVVIFKIIVDSNFSTVGKVYLPGIVGANSPVSQISVRAITISECPNDFSSRAVLISDSSSDFVISFTTESSRAGIGKVLVQPNKVYYLNIKNVTCPLANPQNPYSGICDLDGQYRNWNQ